MSLRETALLAVIVLTGVPVLASYFRNRLGVSWALTLLAGLTLSCFLGVLWKLIDLRGAPGGEALALAALGLGVPMLLSGYLFAGVLGRKEAATAVRALAPGLSLLSGFGVLALIFLMDPSFLSGYQWHGGTGTLTLGPLGKAFLSYLLVGAVFVGQNLERAYRLAKQPGLSALQPVILGFFGVLGFLAYVLTTALMYGTVDLDNLVALAVPLTVSHILTGYGFLRGTLVDTDVPVSRDVVYSSFTVTVAVLYFVAMGAAAQLATLTGWQPGHVVTASFVFLVVIVALGVLFTDRFKQGIRRYIDRNFYVHRHDYRSHWARLTRDLDPSQGIEELLQASDDFLRDAFHADEVSLALGDSTRPVMRIRHGKGLHTSTATLNTSSNLVKCLQQERRAILLTGSEGAQDRREYAEESPDWFTHAAGQVMAPLLAGNELLGVVGLERKHSGDPFTVEDLELLDYAASQVAAVLRGAEWGRELADAREVELLSSWSNMLVHDLKNYLSPLRMIVQNMQHHIGNPDFQKDAVADIAMVTGRMESLMTRLSHLRKGSTSDQVVNLSQLVEESITALNIERTQIRVETNLALGAEVRGDMAMLRRVTENLLTNAVQAMKGTGMLTVRTEPLRKDDGWEGVEIEVTDTGSGMTEAFIRDRLFRPFATTKREGLGLGLYQCRRIIEAHGGEIHVESNEGEGTSFKVHLPAMAHQRPSPSGRRAVPASAR